MHKDNLDVILSTIPAEEIARVKGLGCLRDKTSPDRFNVRVVTRNGRITADEAHALADAAVKFGNGKITMTSRLGVEIQSVHYDNIVPLQNFLLDVGLETGGTGPKVRPVVSCKGTTCQYGLIDTFSLSEMIHERFYKGYHNTKLPHKFKIAVGGCPNNCVKPDINDLGIIGQRAIIRNLKKCKGCSVCQVMKACPVGACHVENGSLFVDPDKCNNCGRCLGKCPFHVNDEFQHGFAIYIGGRWGKKVTRGRRLNHLFTSTDSVLDLIEKCILLYRDLGQPGERLADTIDRIGFETFENDLLEGL